MTMKPIDKKKLALTSETLRTLSSEQLGGVNGGGLTNITQSCACHSFVCSIAGNCATAGGGGGK
jgi:hypothetical protein